jgi:peptide/nickel transport system permease protein
MVPTIAGVALLVFMLLRFAGGDVADLLLAESQAAHDPVMKEQVRKDLGLTGSPVTQFVTWVGNVSRGDFGKSYYSGRSVRGDLDERLPVTFELGLLAIVVSILIGIPIGAISAIHQDTWLDYVTRGSAIMFLSIPSFVTALVILQLGRNLFQWAPPPLYHDLWDDPLQNIYIMATPVLILGISLAAIQARFFRAQMLEVMRQDYIRTARAKGLSSRTVLMRHALKNALIPVITVIGLQIPVAITGTLILEVIFLIPGVGRLLVDAARRDDYPIVQAVTLLTATSVVMVNLLIDLSYSYLDPRIKESYR